MAQADYPYRNDRTAPKRENTVARSGWMREWWFRMLVVLFFAELIVPFLLWRAGLPRSMDFFKEIVAGVIVLLTFSFILLRDRIPLALLFILGVSLIWSLVPILDGQTAGATLWGWWRFFKYPLLLIFAYLIPRWPKDFPRWFMRFLIVLMLFEIGVQLVQLAMGEPPGDSLAGTFGWKGVASYSMFVFFAVCIGFGHWVATGEWKTMLLILVLGLVGSMLNVTKFYLLAVAVMGAAALVLHMLRGGQVRQLFVYVILFTLSFAAFVPIYNSFIANTRGLKPLQEYLDPDLMEEYLFNDGKGDEDGQYNFGRGFAITYAWQQIQRDNTTMLFGFGMDSRTYSAALGITGASLAEDLYGSLGDTGMGQWLQEFGVLGVVLFNLLNFWIMWRLFRHARTVSDPNLAAMEYGLILFTFLWPLWLWYHRPWIAGVMMVLYWVSLGYVFRQIYPRPRRVRRPAATRALDEPTPHATDARLPR